MKIGIRGLLKKLIIALIAVAIIGVLLMLDQVSIVPKKPTIEEAKGTAANKYMDLEGVVGVGIGKSEGEPVVHVYVEEKKSELLEKLPEEIKEYKVKIIESGKFKVL